MKTSVLLLSVVMLACAPSGEPAAGEATAPICEDAGTGGVAGGDPMRARVFFSPRYRLPVAVRERAASSLTRQIAQLPGSASDPSLAGATFAAPARIVTAIVKASAVTGADFEFLLKTAALESSFDQNTEAKTSSAVGLFQFIEHTWLFMIREVGPELGLGDLAAAVAVTEKGEFEIADTEMEAAILGLRYDPEISAIMAGAFARRNAEFAARQLGREPNAGELYIAHFLGANGGVELIRLVEKEPRALARKHFASAARANRSIFYDGRRPRTVAEVHDRLLSKYRRIPIYANPDAVGSIN
jgi:hypothetical protein